MERLVLDCVRRGLTDEQATKILHAIPSKVRASAFHDWSFMGRPDQQLPPGNWNTWAVCAGRGNGKSRTGANACKTESLTTERIALVGATAADVRDVMIEGESGLLAQFPKKERPVYVKSSRCVRFHSGAMGFCYSAEQPNRLRGPQHGFAWADEPSAWKAPEKVMANLKMGLRLGRRPRAVLTFTPKKTPFIKAVFADAADPSKRIHLTRGKTTDNFFSLTAEWFEEMYASFGGSRLGRQELDGELLEEVDALFQEGWILHDAKPATYRGKFKRVVVAADPSGSGGRRSDEYGIVVNALGHDNRGYVLADLSGKMTPDAAGQLILQAYDDFGADLVIGETNYGADTLDSILRLAALAKTDGRKPPKFKGVRSKDNKELRADPVAALYEQKRITHLGFFTKLEEEMTSWNPQDKTLSPGRIDALVIGFKELICDQQPIIPSYLTTGLRIIRRGNA